MTLAWDQFGSSIAAVLAQKAAERGQDVFLHWLDDRGGETALTFQQVYEGAAGAAGALAQLGVKRGDRVMIGLPTGVAFLNAFFGTLLLGAIAVPFYPPARLNGLEAYESALAAQVTSVKPRLLVTFARARQVIESATYAAGARVPVVVPENLNGHAAPAALTLDPDAVALIQFTSGSTRQPKGVVLTHRQLLNNIASIVAAVGLRVEDRACSWLPLYHDMGLIGMLLTVLFRGTPLVLMSPQSFLLDPKRWLWAIDRFRCTISTAPNFAYHLCAQRLQDQELQGLDLTSWRLAYSGAETVQAETMHAFATRFSPYGLAPSAITPIYGLAEMAVAVTFCPPERGLRLDRLSADRLESEQVAGPPEEGRTATVASVGFPIPGHAVRIQDATGGVLPERAVGEVWVSGPSLMQGYWESPDRTLSPAKDGWLDTGDRGYLADGELFITGRSKDLIIKAGRNYAPSDLEFQVGKVPGVRAGNVAAFSLPDPASGTEKVVVLAESRQPAEEYPQLAAAVAAQLRETLALHPDHVAILTPGQIPKTSSGKVRRQLARERFLAGTLAPAADNPLWSATRRVGRAWLQRLSVENQERGHM
ncbi:MAG: fatty acyl-AMP ligase [Candidatus Sericytochromatia bacterium]|nr:fatty acyl-AMP ligase [Candidatus Sericytochromatia bacterium]